MEIDRCIGLSALALVGSIFFILTGCSTAQDHSGRLQRGQVRPALQSLPFQYKLWAVKPPAGDDAAFQGVAYGKYGSILRFSIGLGAHPRTIPIPKTKLQSQTGEGETGFAFNSDTADAEKFKTLLQWHAAMDMSIEIQETLCRRANGQPCPV